MLLLRLLIIIIIIIYYANMQHIKYTQTCRDKMNRNTQDERLSNMQYKIYT